MISLTVFFIITVDQFGLCVFKEHLPFKLLKKCFVANSLNISHKYVMQSSNVTINM
jgi:hypothetical protein